MKIMQEDWITHELFVCECKDASHMLVLYQDTYKDDTWPPTVEIQLHLNDYLPIWKRAWRAIQYVLGVRSRRCEFDSFMLEQKDIPRMINELQGAYNVWKAWNEGEKEG